MPQAALRPGGPGCGAANTPATTHRDSPTGDYSYRATGRRSFFGVVVSDEATVVTLGWGALPLTLWLLATPR